MRTLFLQAPSFDGYDGGAGSRYQAKREIKSFWYPTWLAQPAALVPDSKLIDAPAHDQSWDDIAHEFDDRDLVILDTSTPSFNQDIRTARLIKERGRRCQKCGRTDCRIFGDHIIEIQDGGARLDPSNISLKCGRCHTTKTLQARKERLQKGHE